MNTGLLRESPLTWTDPDPISLKVLFSTLVPETSKRTVFSGGFAPMDSTEPTIAENDPEPSSLKVFFSTLVPDTWNRTVESGGLISVDSAAPVIAESVPDPLYEGNDFWIALPVTDNVPVP
jgi:hypothetical protein